jgi:hypothetical protein
MSVLFGNQKRINLLKNVALFSLGNGPQKTPFQPPFPSLKPASVCVNRFKINSYATVQIGNKSVHFRYKSGTNGEMKQW